MRLWLLLVGLGLLVAASGQERPDGKRKGPPPLVVDKKTPLLLDAPEPDDKPKAAAADNGACFVCHVNYKEELLAVTHAEQNLGCAKCHGPSLAHCNDENNTTPPDVLYPAKGIEAACGKCHRDHDVPAAKVVARWTERALSRADPALILCTDCHGRHRLKVRTVRWDKATRKLLPAAGSSPRK